MNEAELRRIIRDCSENGFDRAQYNAIWMEGGAGMGKTSLLIDLVHLQRQSFQSQKRPETACGLVAQRGVCAQLCGGETEAYFLDTGAGDQSFR